MVFAILSVISLLLLIMFHGNAKSTIKEFIIADIISVVLVAIVIVCVILFIR